MCRESYNRDQKKFNKNLETDLNTIYKPLKNQNKGGIEALKDSEGKLKTEPKKVAEIHAKELTKEVKQEGGYRAPRKFRNLTVLNI